MKKEPAKPESKKKGISRRIECEQFLFTFYSQVYSPVIRNHISELSDENLFRIRNRLGNLD